MRQFGTNTCEVGYGLPSGHVQVTAAVYLLLAAAARRAWVTTAVVLFVSITAVSRVHMGAHTALQVLAGALAGLGTARAVKASSSAIRGWAAASTAGFSRVATAGLVTLTQSRTGHFYLPVILICYFCAGNLKLKGLAAWLRARKC